MRECEEMKYDRALSLSEWVRQNVGFALRESVIERERENDELCITTGAMSFPHFLEIV